ncbi:MAG: tandem-95 repeat protein, partial [Candidatus Neomarinimicrobiota bacterium]
LDGDDVDGDNLTYILTSDPSNGSASINGNILTYNANQDWNGEETFSYKANDGHLDSNVSTITITVNPVNDNPVVSNPANSKALNGEHDYINLGPVINFNNNNPNSTPPGLGSWSLIFNARIDHLDDNGRAAILSSGVDATNQGVFFGIYTINGIPRLSLDFYQVDNLASDDVSSIIGDGVFHSFAVTYSGSSAKLFLDGVKVAENSFAGNYGNNDQDLWLGLSPWNNFNDLNGYLNYGAIWTGEHSEDDILDMHNGTENPGDHPTNLQGWWDFNSNSSFEDLSTNNFTASYATNGTQGEDVNLSLNEDSSIDIDLQSYVYDVDNDALTYTIVNQPENGTLTFISDSEIRYEPAANYNGLDEFSWKVNDGTVDSNTSTINIEVISVNDSPTTDGGKTYSTPYDTALDIVLSGEDVDGDNLTFSVTETSTSGSATIEISNNIATITPTTTNSVNTKISFKYQVSDGNLNSEETTVAIWLIGNEFTNPTSSSEWMVGTTETIAWTRGPDFDTSSGLFLVKDGDYENRITIVNPIPTQGSNLVNSYDYVIPNDLELSNDYQVLIAQATNDFPDGQYHYSETFAISASTTTKSYTLDSSDSVSGNSFYEYTINVPDQGRLLDADFTISLNGNSSSHLRYMNLLLISPNKSRILLAGGDFQSVECGPTGGCISASANTFTNTTFDDEASTNIHAGSPPFIGSFLPNQPLSTFDDEEINGDWTFVVINRSSSSINPPDLELTLTYDPNLSGSTYQEENNFIFSPSDQSLFTVAGNSTGVITIPVSLTGNQAISDLDFELSLDGNSSSHLRYLSVTVDIGNSNNAKLIFRGDFVSGSGNAYSRSQASINKARFDDEASLDYSASLMFNQRVHTIENNALATFDGQSLNEFRIYIYNSSTSSLTVDRAKTKLFLDVSSSTGNNAPVTNDVSSKGYVEDGSLDIALDGSDEDGNSLTYSIVSNPSNGTVSINNNIATYTPVNFSGADSFTYKANDGTDDSNVSTVNVGMYDIGKTSLYFNRDLSAGIEKSYLELPQNAGDVVNSYSENWGFTISMWLKPEAQLYNQAYLYSNYVNANNYWGLKLNDKGDGNASISFEAVKDGNSVLNIGTIDFNGNLTVPLDGNTWTHVLVHLYRGNNSYVQIAGFKNGQEVHSTSNYYYDFQDLLYTLRGREIIIGTQRKDVANDTQYKGYLDEVLFLNGSASTGKMSSSHVAELYNNGYNLINPSNYFGTAYGFQADYNFNQNSGLPVDEIGGVTATEMTGAIWVTE